MLRQGSLTPLHWFAPFKKMSLVSHKKGVIQRKLNTLMHTPLLHNTHQQKLQGFPVDDHYDDTDWWDPFSTHRFLILNYLVNELGFTGRRALLQALWGSPTSYFRKKRITKNDTMPVLVSQICKSDFAEGGLFLPLFYWNVSKQKEQWLSNSTDKGKQRRSSSLHQTYITGTRSSDLCLSFSNERQDSRLERQHPASDHVINLALHAALPRLGGSIEHLANQRKRKADRPSARPGEVGVINAVFQFMDKNINGAFSLIQHHDIAISNKRLTSLHIYTNRHKRQQPRCSGRSGRRRN